MLGLKITLPQVPDDPDGIRGPQMLTAGLCFSEDWQIPKNLANFNSSLPKL